MSPSPHTNGKPCADDLARDGIAAIWALHLAAEWLTAMATREMAQRLIEIADAAEREWFCRAKPLAALAWLQV